MGLVRSKESRESFDRSQHQAQQEMHKVKHQVNSEEARYNKQANEYSAERKKSWKHAFFALHWEKRLIAVCIYLIMSQWTTALIPYWYEETIEMTRKMLDGVLVLTLLFPAVAWVRLLAGIFVVIWSVRAGGHAYELWDSVASYEGVRNSFSDYHPYVWLVGLIWCTYEIFNQTVRWTWHVMILLVIQFIVFGALDSFTADELWDQVAWLTGASLVWLIAVHFRSISRRFPHMWRGSVRYPIQMLISAVVLISLIVTSGVSMPRVQPILQDPYTTWVNGGYGDGIGGGTSQANATSGYSRTDQELGGGFTLDFTPVMNVTSDVRGYWRGETKFTYNGDGWEDSVSQLDEPLPNEQLSLDMRPDELLPKRRIEQKIEMLNEETYQVLFGMGTITSYEIISSEQQGTVRWGARDAELWYYSKPESYPKAYNIVSESVILEPDLAIQATKDGSTPEYGLDQNWDPYLQLPDTVSARVKNLAYDLTRDVENDYERAVLIEKYLREEFFYTTKPDLSKKKSEDFVDSFLFEMREGYCDYYSSSMAVMLRSLGVPTRWVKGYAPGTNTYMMDGGRPDQMNSPADDLGSATYRVTNADAHSWVEVWLDEYGWVAFEPTPGFNLPIISEDTDSEKEQAQEPELKQEESKPDEQKKEESEASLPAWVEKAAQIIIMLSAAAALAYMLFRWSQVGFSLRWFRLLSKKLSMRERIILETEMWLSYCRMKGWRRAKGETVREMVARSFTQDDNRRHAAEQIVAAFEEAKYSGRELNEEDWQQLKNAVRRFKHPRSTVL
ncbi:transglutaminase TgpA family protein [Paenibacillus agilis]|uniref:Transglutaminase domain-containing protein n=1 Tax=Paenibacillus agilis TaxID=3020863 RepID=A0A559J395_9BACL|nr:transglutaminase domain-containing protein [Paenibacillus agilis]TVX94355.1 transglutaminase domain-containing protein [Paenibacillus agilis]